MGRERGREGTGDANGLRWVRGWLGGEVPAAIGDLHILKAGPSPLITSAIFFFTFYFDFSGTKLEFVHNVVHVSSYG